MKSLGDKITVNVTVHTDEGSKTFAVNESTFYIGRAPECAVKLEDANVSRKHVQVTVADGQIFVTDQKSANGTQLNGTKLQEFKPMPMTKNDRLNFSKTNISVTIEVASSIQTDQTLMVRTNAPAPAPAPSRAAARTPTPVAPPAPAGRSPSFMTSDLHKPQRMQADPPPSPQPRREDVVSLAKDQANQILAEAKRQAAQTVFEAEEKAYEASKAIHQKALDIKTTAESEAQEIVAGARREAERLHHENLEMGRHMIAEAKAKAEALRLKIVEDYESRAKAEAEDKIRELIERRDNLQTNVEKLEAEASDRSAELESKNRELQSLRIEAQSLEAASTEFRSEITQLENQKIELSREAEDLVRQREQLEQAAENAQQRKLQVDEMLTASQAEMREMEEMVSARRNELEAKKKELSNLDRQLKESEKERFGIEEVVKVTEQRKAQLQKEVAQLDKQRIEAAEAMKQVELKKQDLQNKLNQIEDTVRDAERKIEIQLRDIKKKGEGDVQRLKEQSEQTLQAFVAEEQGKLEKLRTQMFRDLDREQESLANDIHQRVWKVLLQDVHEDVFKRNKKGTLQQIKDTISERLMGMVSSHNTEATVNVEALKKKTVQQQLQWVMTGFAVALMLIFAAWYVQEQLKNKTFASEAEAERKSQEAARLARRFQPEQDYQIRETYVDAVIYTKNFSQAYADQETHDRFVKASSDYLYRQWRIEEEKTIEVLAVAKALVMTLDKRRKEIHPDFVKENIEKMRQTENESTARMKELLGTNVKFEAFKKFENRFFAGEVAKRLPANTN